MKKLVLGLCLSILAFNLPVVSADTGTRLGDRGVSNMAEYHYERGTKAANKAAKLYDEAMAAADGKQASLKKKADKQYKKAIGLYEKALRVNRSYPGIRTDLGLALMRTGQYDKAVTVLTEAAERRPSDEVIAQQLAEAQAAAGS